MYEIERKLPGVQIKKFKYRDNKFIISKCSRLQKGWLNFPLQLYCDFDSDIICWLCINWIFCFEKPFKHRPIQYFTKVAEGFKHWIKCWKYIHCIKLPVVFHSYLLPSNNGMFGCIFASCVIVQLCTAGCRPCKLRCLTAIDLSSFSCARGRALLSAGQEPLLKFKSPITGL